MIYGERTRRKLDWVEGKGLTGELHILCDWSDVDPTLSASLPQYGDPWTDPNGSPSTALAFLRCKSIHMQEGEIAQCEFIAEYSTQNDLTGGTGDEAWFKTSCGIGKFVMPDMTGWVWYGTGTPVFQQLPDPDGAPYSVTMRVQSRPTSWIHSAQYKVNDRVFHGAAAGSLLFMGATSDEDFGMDGDIVAANVNYTFLYRALNHNYFWRKPVQLIDPFSYTPLFYHDILGRYGYTSDTTLRGTPVYYPGPDADGTYNAPSGQGVGAWDVPMYGANYIYEECDFGTVLGIPILAGDDAIGVGS
jgi:hypothetical protein